MAPLKIKPLVSTHIERSNETQFKHFGVLDAGHQGKGSTITSVTVNVLLAAIICLLGAAAQKTIEQQKLINLTYIAPVEPPKPKPIIKQPKLPPPPKMETAPPKIIIPTVKMPEPPKMPVVKLQPAPVDLPPAPPKKVTAPAAPKPVNLAQKPAAASIPNNMAPSPIRLGQTDNPIKNASGPPTSPINLGRAGAPGMPASNTGLGANKVSLGNGQPNGGMRGNGVQTVQGVKLGVTGGQGPMNSPGRGAGTVNLAANNPPPPPSASSAPSAVGRGNPPKILSQPKPVYTAEATARHIEGIIMVHVRLTATGGIEVLGIANDLGYGLGQSARQAVQGIHFQPATDASGRPVDWTGEVKVIFEIAG